MRRLLHRAEQSSLIQCDRQGDFGERIDRVKIDSGDLGGIDVQSEVPDMVLAQRRVFALGADRDRYVEPLTSLDAILGDDFRRMLRI